MNSMVMIIVISKTISVVILGYLDFWQLKGPFLYFPYNNTGNDDINTKDDDDDDYIIGRPVGTCQPAWPPNAFRPANQIFVDGHDHHTDNHCDHHTDYYLGEFLEKERNTVESISNCSQILL